MCEEGGLERERAVKEGVLVSKRAPSQCSLKYRAHGMNAGHKCGMKPCMAPMPLNRIWESKAEEPQVLE